ncbi:fluoride efflux transporter FluC [Pseudactinotalea sp. Z1739]|uniref:fluoride efflux transporter FluC n=1 Tax=Pseudactinotalea sp. Z1739 TaxID=3413028 RepID=UPI003C7A3259
MSGLGTALVVALAGGVGSALRFLADRAVPTRARDRYPWGTMIVNLTGSLALGVLTGMLLDHTWAPVLTVGLLGGYTTFSTASLECLELLRQERRAAALLHGPGMIVACTAVAISGILLTAT